ncbi:MAG: IclR family transcriptional regulator C-terminal domain-containing protein [Bacillota bacterium]
MAPMPFVQALERALDILEAFSPQNYELGITDLSQRVNLSPPTVSRLVQTLVARGYLTQNPENKKYRLSFKFLDFTAVIHAAMDLYQVSIPVLSRLRDKLKETVYIDVMDGDERVCVISFPGIHAVRTVVPVGQRSPLYAGADSRMLLASLDGSEIEDYIERVEFSVFTANTITDKQKLREVIRKSREMDMSISVSEFHPGSACVSVPIRDYSAKVVGVLSVSFPDSRADLETFHYYARAVRQAAADISAAMGFKGRAGPRDPSSLISYIEDYLRKGHELNGQAYLRSTNDKEKNGAGYAK